jgi:hypothetical protein
VHQDVHRQLQLELTTFRVDRDGRFDPPKDQDNF